MPIFRTVIRNLGGFKRRPESNEMEHLRKLFSTVEGMLSFDEACFLYSSAKAVNNGCIVEIGSYRGLSTVFLCLGSQAGSGAPVYAVDPHRPFGGVLGGVFGPKDREAFYEAMVVSGCGKVVSLINLSSEQFAASWTEPVSLLWLDGDHRYAAVKRDFECWKPHLSANAVAIFHDATDESLGPFELIKELVATGTFEKVASVGSAVAIHSTLTSGDKASLESIGRT